MKTVVAVILGFVLPLLSYADQPSNADKKWADTIEKLVASGTVRFSTQSQERVELAKALQPKLGKKLRVEKTELGFNLFFENGPPLKTASVK